MWSLAEGRFPGLLAARRNIESARTPETNRFSCGCRRRIFRDFLLGRPTSKCKTAEEFALEGRPGELGGANHCTENNTAQTLNSSTIQNYLPIYGALVQLGIRITQPLYTFGKLTAAWDLGQTGVDIASAQSEQARLDHQINVLKAYFGLKTARAALDTVSEGLDQGQKWVKQMDIDLEAGKGSASEIDLMRLKVAESQIELISIDLDRTIASTLAALRYLVQDKSVDVDDENLLIWHDENEPLDYYLDAALRNRPELKVLRRRGRARLYLLQTAHR